MCLSTGSCENNPIIENDIDLDKGTFKIKQVLNNSKDAYEINSNSKNNEDLTKGTFQIKPISQTIKVQAKSNSFPPLRIAISSYGALTKPTPMNKSGLIKSCKTQLK